MHRKPFASGPYPQPPCERLWDRAFSRLVLWEGSNQGGVEYLDQATFKALEVLPLVGLELDASPPVVNEGQASAWAVADHHDVGE